MNFLKALFFFALFSTAIIHGFAQISSTEINLANEYYNDGDYEKSLDLYEKALKHYPETEYYVLRIVSCYIQLNKPDEARSFLSSQQKKKNLNKGYLQALEGKIYEYEGNTAKSTEVWTNLITDKLKDLNDFYKIGGFFMQEQKYKWALKTYASGREKLKTPYIFAGELAYLYQFDNNFAQSAKEYINLYYQNPNQFSYVKSQIMRMVKDDRAEEIESTLLNEAQIKSDDVNILELLYDFYVESNNYEEALIQARALDKLKRESGNRLFKLAQTLQNNKEYEISNKALDIIIESYKDNSPYYLDAIVEKAKNFELKSLSQIPLDTAGLRQSVINYDQLFKNFGRLPQLSEAMYRKARICVFYLNDLPCAISELDQIEKLPMPIIKKAESKLLMGDVLVLQGEYNKAKLKYSEVEKAFENTQIGSMAKYRAAKLSYYKGDFEDSKAYLKILKENTTTDIANDAIRLYLMIQDNTGLDSTTTALEKFADAELMIYQKRYDAALVLLDSIAYNFPNHPLADDIIWQKAQIYLNQGKIDESLALFDKILEKYSEDIYADDAQFTKAEIYDFIKKDKKKAEELYFEILTKFPASLYKVEARKRVRKLRGDKIN